MSALPILLIAGRDTRPDVLLADPGLLQHQRNTECIADTWLVPLITQLCSTVLQSFMIYRAHAPQELYNICMTTCVNMVARSGTCLVWNVVRS